MLAADTPPAVALIPAQAVLLSPRLLHLLGCVEDAERRGIVSGLQVSSAGQEQPTAYDADRPCPCGAVR